MAAPTNQRLTVRTKGVAELVRAADAAGGDTKKRVRDALRAAAVPVRDTVRQRLADAGVSARTISGVGISVRRTGIVSVEQRRRKTSGARSSFGAFQMTDAFVPGLQRHAGATERRITDAVDDVLDTFGRRP